MHATLPSASFFEPFGRHFYPIRHWGWGVHGPISDLDGCTPTRPVWIQLAREPVQCSTGPGRVLHGRSSSVARQPVQCSTEPGRVHDTGRVGVLHTSRLRATLDGLACNLDPHWTTFRATLDGLACSTRPGSVHLDPWIWTLDRAMHARLPVSNWAKVVSRGLGKNLHLVTPRAWSQLDIGLCTPDCQCKSAFRRARKKTCAG